MVWQEGIFTSREHCGFSNLSLAPLAPFLLTLFHRHVAVSRARIRAEGPLFFLCKVSLASQQSCSCSCQPLAPSSSTPSPHTPLGCQSVSCTPAHRTWPSWRRTHFSFSPSAAWRLDTPSACLRCFCCHRHEHTWVILASVSVRSDERPCASTVLVLSERRTHTHICARMPL